MKNKSLSLREIVMQLAGFASMCWEPIPKGVFDSSRAIKKVEEALSSIEAHYRKRRLSEDEIKVIIMQTKLNEEGTMAMYNIKELATAIFEEQEKRNVSEKI